MLGVLASRKEPALAFLRGLLGSPRLSGRLSGFLAKHGRSFMQNRPAAATRCLPP
jgi:hypothetical protein